MKKLQETTPQPNSEKSRNNLTDYVRAKNDSWNGRPSAGNSDGAYPHKDYYIFHNIALYVRTPLPEHIDLHYVLRTVEGMLPQEIIESTGVEMILIGDFEELAEREIQSVWKQDEGTIMVTNEQDSNEDMIDDIVHEFAHATEDTYGFELYADDAIEKEFLLKRRHLYDILSAHGHEAPLQQYLHIGYRQEFDQFLYKEVGYEKLTHFTMGLFTSPYAATSVREYFASGFEEYFLESGDRTTLGRISPALYTKISELLN